MLEVLQRDLNCKCCHHKRDRTHKAENADFHMQTHLRTLKTEVTRKLHLITFQNLFFHLKFANLAKNNKVEVRYIHKQRTIDTLKLIQ